MVGGGSVGLEWVGRKDGAIVISFKGGFFGQGGGKCAGFDAEARDGDTGKGFGFLGTGCQDAKEE